MPTGLLVLVDISGYTQFMQGVDQAHGEQIRASAVVPPAFPILTGLLDGIVDKMTPMLKLSKVEGDAIFAFGPDGESDLHGQSVLRCMENCYTSFRSNLRMAGNLMHCDCAACGMLPTLELKFIFHHGGYVLHSVAGHDDLAGQDVNIAHMLLKNRVREATGYSGYALFTEAAIRHLDLPVKSATGVTEEYEHYSPIQAYAFALG